jgi:hypothetical protein
MLKSQEVEVEAKAEAEVEAKAEAKAEAKRQQYRCLSPLDHTGDHRLYLPGAVITLDHLSPVLIRRLVDGGHVVAVDG